ncbi:unnamed protein product [Rotaria sordida]|uniref:Clathrin/coatomer adaptor adaptin-like N-terminal domain-containing protein n=1 Tax=Rotaria sordida TaxID=392033 RepID=A0A819NUS8_9BILA|nr:unnamed protein product [Rotaria sordida]
MIRKDLNSPSMYETDIAMSDLSCFINSDLARDLANEIMTLMTSTKPYIPAVNAICELARRNPENDLVLAAIFFCLMTTSTNNWVLIKIIKLIFVPISSDLPNNNASIQLCVQKLRILIEDSDQNLKYIGLLAMSTILHTHPKSIQSHSDLIMHCLNLLSRMAILLENDYVFIHDSNSTTVSEVLYAAAWICSGFCSSKFLDLEGWINGPQSDSEDESITTSSYYDNKGLFYDDNGENSNSNSYSGDTLSYQKSKKYIESTAEELEKQRESKKTKKKSKTDAKLIHDNDDDIYPTVKVTLGGELPENATESENKDNDNDKKKIIEKQEQLSTSKSKHKRERSDDKELLSPADEEENRPTSSTPSPPPPTTAEKTKVKKSSSETTTIVYTNTSVPLLLDIMTDDIHPTNQSEQQYNEQGTYKLAGQSNNLTIEYLINPDPLIVQVDVTFLLENRTSFIIDHINIHVICSMNSKLLNTTSANLISFPSISLFPHSQNYIPIYFF